MASVLDNADVRRELREAWRDSLALGAEIGGFILEAKDGTLLVVRWLPGTLDEVEIPDHSGCQYAGLNIRATFHTHPTPPPFGLEEPSPDDMIAIGDDLDLRADYYEGEYVIATHKIYRILSGAAYEVWGERSTLEKE